jgi:hypothetical protein
MHPFAYTRLTIIFALIAKMLLSFARRYVCTLIEWGFRRMHTTASAYCGIRARNVQTLIYHVLHSILCIAKLPNARLHVRYCMGNQVLSLSRQCPTIGPSCMHTPKYSLLTTI